jgi:reactive intermediate/imine deaminase
MIRMLQHATFFVGLGLSMAWGSVCFAQSVEFINSGKVFAPNVPFSEAVRVDDVVYLSGQIGLLPGVVPATLVKGGIREEARQTLENIRTSLQAQGLDLRNVVKCTVILADIGEWGIFNEVYKTFFSAPYPARTALASNGLVAQARVEVDCIAHRHR